MSRAASLYRHIPSREERDDITFRREVAEMARALERTTTGLQVGAQMIQDLKAENKRLRDEIEQLKGSAA